MVPAKGFLVGRIFGELPVLTLKFVFIGYMYLGKGVLRQMYHRPVSSFDGSNEPSARDWL